uniref:Uncharacterized protein n=1 Tax=Sus scrofa TaxID=9823 RepID=A0A4X1TH03_PIG
TVGFPWSAPVLSRLLGAGRGEAPRGTAAPGAHPAGGPARRDPTRTRAARRREEAGWWRGATRTHRTPPRTRARARAAGARRRPPGSRGRPRRPPQLGRSTGRARLASRVAAAAGPRVPGPRGPAGPRGDPPATGPRPLPPFPRHPSRRPPPAPAEVGGGGREETGEGGAGGGSRAGGAEEDRGAGPAGVPRAWGGGGASSSRGARPAPLRAPARPTQPLEPILIPKLRIRLADFPYLHCSNMPEAVHLGDLLRIWVRPGARFTPSPRIFKGQRELTGRRRNRDAFQGTGPSLGANPFQGALPFTKKRELSRGSRRLLRDRLRYRTGRLAAPISATPDSGSEPDSLSIG